MKRQQRTGRLLRLTEALQSPPRSQAYISQCCQPVNPQSEQGAAPARTPPEEAAQQVRRTPNAATNGTAATDWWTAPTCEGPRMPAQNRLKHMKPMKITKAHVTKYISEPWFMRICTGYRVLVHAYMRQLQSPGSVITYVSEHQRQRDLVHASKQRLEAKTKHPRATPPPDESSMSEPNTQCPNAQRKHKTHTEHLKKLLTSRRTRRQRETQKDKEKERERRRKQRNKKESTEHARRRRRNLRTSCMKPPDILLELTASKHALKRVMERRPRMKRQPSVTLSCARTPPRQTSHLAAQLQSKPQHSILQKLLGIWVKR